MILCRCLRGYIRTVMLSLDQVLTSITACCKACLFWARVLANAFAAHNTKLFNLHTCSVAVNNMPCGTDISITVQLLRQPTSINVLVNNFEGYALRQ